MPHIQKTGIYSWEVKRLGVLPGVGTVIGQSPTGPITSAGTPTGTAYDEAAALTNQAGAGAPSPGSPDAVFHSLQLAACNAYSDASRNGPISSEGHMLFPSGYSSLRNLANLCSQIRVISTPDNARRWQQVYPLLQALADWERWQVSRFFTYRGLGVTSPVSDRNAIALLMSDLLSTWTTSSVPAPGIRPMVKFSPLPMQSTSVPKLPGNFMSTQPGGSSSFTPPGADTTVHTSDPSPPVFTPPDPSTNIVNVTPQDSPPPSSGSGSGGATESWKPFAAVAIGAIVGVLVGRAIT